MASITPGTGATLKADTAEGQLLEAVTLAKLWEREAIKNPTNRNAITYSLNVGSATASVSLNMPMLPGIDSQGRPYSSAQSYLQQTNFTPGDGGTFKSNFIEAYILEVATYLQIQEANTAKNPEGLNNVSVDISMDDNTMSASINIPIINSVGNNGEVIAIADEYLLD